MTRGRVGDRQEMGVTEEFVSSTFEEVVANRYGRRDVLKFMAVGAGGIAGAAVLGFEVAGADETVTSSTVLVFDSVPLNGNDAIGLPPGYEYNVILSWGDPVVPGAPAFDIDDLTPEAQAMQAGYNHDYVDYRPLPWNSKNSDHGLLWINHEYTDSAMMFQNYTSTKKQVDVELAAHGGTVIEVYRNADGSVGYDPTGWFNRRITATTPMKLSGPVAGDARVKTTDDPTGTVVLGMLNNCGGGNTPWGTIVTCEENFDQYFGNGGASGANITDAYVKSTVGSVGVTSGASARKWETHYDRFDLTKEPREYLRFGYVVEIDPYVPDSVPKKRTAMGRFKHEAAAGALATGGQWVSYSGDDQVNQCIYKFVTEGKVNLHDRWDNMDLLDEGTLYAAKFNADGTGAWLPLVFGTGPLVAPAFTDQVDVLIRTRQAAAALGATKMARPEDVEVSPVTKKVYAVMTGNSGGEVNAANPRSGGSSIAGQGLGHVVEIVEADDDNAALTFTWNVLLLCGEPNATGTIATTSSPAALNSAPDNVTWFAGYDETKVTPVARVDNIAFDSKGNLFLSTDGQPSALQRSLQGLNDVIIALPVEGPERGHAKALLTAVDGCEVTGPFLSPDDRSLYLSIQHPGVDVFQWTSPTTPPTEVPGKFASPGSAWNTTAVPRGMSKGIPRPATLVVHRTDGAPVSYEAESAKRPGEDRRRRKQVGKRGAALALPAAGLLALRNRKP
ncbi:MAG: PhoX family phosphatase [Acidimicrobiia bacterium]